MLTMPLAAEAILRRAIPRALLGKHPFADLQHGEAHRFSRAGFPDRRNLAGHSLVPLPTDRAANLAPNQRSAGPARSAFECQPRRMNGIMLLIGGSFAEHRSAANTDERPRSGFHRLFPEPVLRTAVSSTLVRQGVACFCGARRAFVN